MMCVAVSHLGKKGALVQASRSWKHVLLMFESRSLDRSTTLARRSLWWIYSKETEGSSGQRQIISTYGLSANEVQS